MRGAALSREPASEYERLAERFELAPDELREGRRLLRRTDSKFVFADSELPAILEPLLDHYRVLRANGSALARYQTLYFDTPDMRCFHDHRRGARPRHKVRVRHYSDRELSFLEVKTRRSPYLTDKERRPLPFGSTDLDADGLDFIGAHCDLVAGALAPQVWTNFRRLTLLGVDTAERITIDTELELVRDGRDRSLRGVAILEVKQSSFSTRTPAMLWLRRRGHRPVSASKYCTAAALSDGSLRMNRLLPAVRMFQRLCPG